MKKITYKSAGVDIKKAEQFVRAIKGMVSKSALAGVSAFGCAFDLQIAKKYATPVLVSSTDGVGTKLIIAQKLAIHNTVGVDLVAMNVNDIICMGAKPLLFLDYIACGKVKPEVLKQVVSGISKGLKDSDCALLGGETAEMPDMYADGEYDLAGFCVGIVDKKKIISGKNIKAGDVVIGLESSGLHSNGFSLARKVLGEKGIRKYAKELLKPTRIYVKPVLSLLKSVEVKGIAHVTGGAFFSKVTKILPPGLGMLINKKSWKAPRIFTLIQNRANVNDREMYTVFNMGIGMIVVASKKNAAKAVANLSKSSKPHVIGVVVKSKKKMELL